MTYCKAKSARLVRKGEPVQAQVDDWGYAQVTLDEDSYVCEMTQCETVIIPVAMIRQIGEANGKGIVGKGYRKTSRRAVNTARR